MHTGGIEGGAVVAKSQGWEGRGLGGQIINGYEEAWG